MKIAVLISGQPRNLNNNIIDLLKKQKIDYDVFINYWEAENGIYSDIGCKECKYIEFLDLKKVKANTIKIEDDIHQKIINKFNPTKISSQKQIKQLTNTQSQFYSIKKAFELIDNPDDYDFIIQTRFDINIRGTLPDFELLDKNKISLLYYTKFYYLLTVINTIMLLLLYLKYYSFLICYLIIYLYIIIDYGTIDTLLHPLILNFNILMPKFINYTLSIIPKKHYDFLNIYDKIEKNQLCEHVVIEFLVKNGIEIEFIETLVSEIDRNYDYI